jgi:hypothetical protein
MTNDISSQMSNDISSQMTSDGSTSTYVESDQESLSQHNQSGSGVSILVVAVLGGAAALLLFAALIIVAIILFQRRNKKKVLKEVIIVEPISRESSLGKGEIQMQELKNIQVKELIGSGIVSLDWHLHLISIFFLLVGNFGEVYKGEILNASLDLSLDIRTLERYTLCSQKH